MFDRDIARAAAFGLGMMVSSPVLAHPHVFAEGRLEIVGTADGKLGAIRNIWRMDELFSSTVLLEFDHNKNGELDGDELDAVGQTVETSIAKFGFFTQAEAAGRAIALAPPDQIHSLWQDGRLLLFFEMSAGDVVDVGRSKLTVSNFDESFYTAFDYKGAEDFILVDMPATCRKTYMVPDEDAAARQWVNAMASVPADQNIPEDGVNYAQILAARLEITCSPD